MKIWHIATGLAVMATLVACKSPTPPKGIQPVNNFNISRYLGKWYEIARMDYYFERGLNHVTAEYSLKNNGTIRVVNRGYDPSISEWKKSEGKALFVGPKNIAALKVSFFGPFYAGYNIIAIDDDYKYALVSGQSRDYLWILSRTSEIPQDIRDKYLDIAMKNGFRINELVWVTQERH
ncbi:outer membrane lipoprotein Blc [Yokenella regensburgei]|uniref:outer membrane lipoprotein Blc n=1 Tax=Yokenella regensburgei TaxID=158877 RepID=UPI003ED86506